MPLLRPTRLLISEKTSHQHGYQDPIRKLSVRKKMVRDFAKIVFLFQVKIKKNCSWKCCLTDLDNRSSRTRPVGNTA